jgi:hypothetical protein
MRVVIDDKPADALTPKQESSFFLSKVQEEVTGRILASDEATTVYVARTRLWYTIVGAIGLVLMVGAVVAGVVGEPRNALFFILFGMVMGALLIAFLALMLRHRRRVFRRKIGHRIEGLMPVGTVLGIGARGLSIGPETFAWPTLALDTVELSTGSLASGDTSTRIMIVERLAVATGGKLFVLDRAMTGNGMLLVDNVWRRLRAISQ